MKRLAIIGSGDLAQRISHYAISEKKFELAGYFDDFEAADTRVGLGTVLGRTDQVCEYYERALFDEILIGVGYKHFDFRQEIFEKLKGRIPLARITHSSAYVDETCKLGEGVVILPGCVLDRNVKVEDNVLISVGCVIAHESTIGAHCYLSCGTKMAGFVMIGECCFLGIGSTISDHIKLCDHCKAGAGAVVIRDTVEPVYYVGVPARPLKPKEGSG